MIICHYFEFTSLPWLPLHNKDLFIGIKNVPRKQKSNQGFRTFQVRVSKSFVFGTEQQYIVLDKTGPEKKYTHF